MPADAAGRAQLVGEARWVRTLVVRVRQGRTREFEEAAKAIKAAIEKAPGGPASYVSQSVVGERGNVYYFSSFRKSLGGFDAPLPSLEELLGAEAYQKFQRIVAEITLGTEVTLSNFLPELSNPPEEIAAVSPDFWRPKPKAAVKPAAAKPEAGKPAAKPAAKAPAAKKKQ